MRCFLNSIHFLGGKGGIRTPGASQHGGFQDRCNRPLYHLSNSLKEAFIEKRCKGTAFFHSRKLYETFFVQK